MIINHWNNWRERQAARGREQCWFIALEGRPVGHVERHHHAHHDEYVAHDLGGHAVGGS